MKSRKILLFLIGLCITCFLTGCKTEIAEGAGNAENPINVAKKHYPEFNVVKIESLMNPKARVGKHSGGFERFTYYAGDSINPETILTSGKRMSELYTASIKRELREAGYKVSLDNNIKAGFSIVVTILSAPFNTTRNVFRPSLVNAEAAITVRWEVSDQEKSKIIYAKKTSGKGETQSYDVEAVLLAFRNSFRAFLASKDMVISIEKYLAK